MSARQAPRLGNRMRGFARSLVASLTLHGVVIGAGLAWFLPRELGVSRASWNARLGVAASEPESFAQAVPEDRALAAEEPAEPVARATHVEEPAALEPERRPSPIPDGVWRLQQLTRSSASLRLEPPASSSVAMLESPPLLAETQQELTPPMPAGVAATGAMLLHDPPPEYPRASVRLGEEGSVLLEILVARDGSVTAAVVLESSGYRRLDDAALAAAAAWRFEPATRAGLPVEARYPHRVTFRLAQPGRRV